MARLSLDSFVGAKPSLASFSKPVAVPLNELDPGGALNPIPDRNQVKIGNTPIVGGAVGGLITDLNSSLQNRGAEFAQNIQSGANRMATANDTSQPGGANPLKAAGIGLETGLRTAGTVAGGALDILGAGIKAVTPGPVKDWLSNLASEFATKQADPNNHSLGSEAIRKIASEFQTLHQQYPEASKDAGAVMNIIGLLAAPKALQQAGDTARSVVSTAKDTASSIQDTVSGIVNKETVPTESKVWDLVQPKLTAREQAQAVAEGKITKTGMLSTVKQIPKGRDLEMIKAAEPYYNQDPIQAVANMKQGIIDEAQSIKGELKSTGAIWNKNELKGALRSIEIPNSVKSDTTLLNNFNNAKADILKLADKAVKTPDGILDVRQGLDIILEDDFGPRIWNRTDGVSKIFRSFRDALNNFADSKVTNGAVKASLKKQTLLYDAIENASTKAPKVGTNIVTRAAEAAKNHPVISTVAGGAAAYETVKLLGL